MEPVVHYKENNLSTPAKNRSLTLINTGMTVLVLLYAFSLSLPITIPWTILTIGLVLLLVRFFFVCKEKLLEEIHLLTNAPLTIPILIFAAATFISGLANGGINEAFKSLWSWRGMLVYFWAYLIFTSNPKLKIFSVASILIASSIAGLWAAIEQLTGFHPFSFPYLQGTGFISGPMAFSGLAQMFSFLALGIAFRGGQKDLPGRLAKPFVFYMILVCNWLGLIFCSERSAWFGAAIALLVVSFLVSYRAAIYTGLLLIISTALGWLVLPVVHERLASLLNWQADVSVSTRIILWDKAWQVFKQSPIFGVGIRHFPHLYIPQALQQGHLALDHAHSNYLHILATTGIVGICAYLYLWISALKISYLDQKNSNYGKLEQGIYLGIFASIVSLAVSGLFEYNFGTGQVRLAQWFLLAMLIQPINSTVTNKSTTCEF